jgi:hypothetical protein
MKLLSWENILTYAVVGGAPTAAAVIAPTLRENLQKYGTLQARTPFPKYIQGKPKAIPFGKALLRGTGIGAAIGISLGLTKLGWEHKRCWEDAEWQRKRDDMACNGTR